MPISNQSETIDPRILRLIGLEDVFDLDYETYLTLLKEAMVKGRMTKKTIPTEEIMLVTDEYKRVKTKKDQGRFEVKKKKISPNSFNVNNVKGILPGTKKSQGLLPSQAIAKSPLTKSLEDNISAITAAVISINETLKNQQKIKSDASAYGKRQAEQEKRSLRESKLEKIFDGLKKTAEKIITPVKSLLDKIFDFIGTVILGRIVYKLVEWMGDPKNASKVKSIIRFVKDWWPALLASYVLFGNSFSGLIRGTIGMVGKFIFQIGKVAIPKLLSLIARNPLATLIVGSSVAGTFARTDERERLKPELDKQRASVEKTEKDSSAPWYQKLGGFFAKQELTTGQQRQSIVAPVPAAMFSGGGPASGFVSGEKGVDKIPAMLSDGEFVMSVGAVEKYGVDTLEAMNAAGGGTNKPKIVGGKTYADGGGSIGSERYSLTPGFSGESSQSDIYLIRAINELVKVLRNKFPSSGSDGGSYPSGSYPSGSSGGSDFPQQLANIAGTIASRGSQIYQGASSLAARAGSVATKKAKPLIEKAKPMVQSLPATMDYGSLYLRSQLGGLGGSITEADLSKQTKDEYAKAFANAKAKAAGRRASIESQVRMYQGILKGPNLTKEQKADAEKQLKVNQSRLAKYKSGQIDVQYADFVDKNGKLSPAARAAQKTLGAVWATDTKDGGFKIEKEPYDFPIINDPWGLINWPKMNKKQREEWLSKQPQGSPHAKQLRANPNSWGKQKIAEAMYSLNPFATPVETDVKIGGKPRAKGIIDTLVNAIDNPLMSMSRGLAMNLLKGKERNVVTGEAEKGSFLDKLFPKKGPPLPKPGQSSGAVTMYKPNDPRRKQTGPYKSRFARPKNAGVKPVKPPTSSKPRVVYGPPVPSSRSSKSNKPAASRVPRFTAGTRGMRSKQETLGLMR
jgi:hypothetical protein